MEVVSVASTVGTLRIEINIAILSKQQKINNLWSFRSPGSCLVSTIWFYIFIFMQSKRRSSEIVTTLILFEEDTNYKEFLQCKPYAFHKICIYIGLAFFLSSKYLIISLTRVLLIWIALLINLSS